MFPFLPILGTIGAIGAGVYSAKKASQAAKQQLQLGREQLADAKEIREQELAAAQAAEDRRRALYGDVEQNLARFYNTMDSKRLTQLGLDRYDKQFKQATDRVQQIYAQRGLRGSGIEAEAMYQMNVESLPQRQAIADNTERLIRDDQKGFLGLSLGDTSLAKQSMANANNAYLNVLGQQQNAWSNIAQMRGQDAAGFFSSAFKNMSIFDTGDNETKIFGA